MKNITSRFKKLIVIMSFAFAGIVAGNLVTPNNATAIHPCGGEHGNECEQGWIWDSCPDNPGEQTYCDWDNDECTTKACGPGHDTPE